MFCSPRGPQRRLVHFPEFSRISFLGSLLQLFKDSLKDIYDNTISVNGAEAHQMLDDYFTALNNATQASTDQHAVDVDNITVVYVFEFIIINKTGGVNSPYATIDLPGIQIPQAIISNLDEKPLKCSFITNAGKWEDHYLTFYERNPAGRELDFTENPDHKGDFLRYAVELHCLDLVANIRNSPLPPLEDLSEGVTVQLATGLKLGTEPERTWT